MKTPQSFSLHCVMASYSAQRSLSLCEKYFLLSVEFSLGEMKEVSQQHQMLNEPFLHCELSARVHAGMQED